ncbi:hypothetical protein HYH03_003433 [Edaphochlamys debaryana]|uniref:Uncharacterized protein n=1 Tax=Edaphochlamys debaryana TaxID=47281 RepID=A0A835Y9T4_9CHLO|nr:hypothetical protein HYH03_003433 [Edaphochlamys debaryana]|eukprot:KAG2498693.1 hypothetical protein HYH03_003433 [Edaphochlamys debaryana]
MGGMFLASDDPDDVDNMFDQEEEDSDDDNDSLGSDAAEEDEAAMSEGGHTDEEVDAEDLRRPSDLLRRFKKRSMKQLQRIHSLSLVEEDHDEKMEAEVVAKLLRTRLPHLRKLELRCLRSESKELQEALACMPNLDTLSIPGFTHVSGLPVLTSLTSLELNNCSEFGDFCVHRCKAKALRRLTSLKKLIVETLCDKEHALPAWMLGEVHRKPVRLLLDYAPKSLETLELGHVLLTRSESDYNTVDALGVIISLRQGSLISMEVASLGSDPPLLLEQVLASRAAPKGRLPLLRYRKEDQWGGFAAGAYARRWRRALIRCDRVEDGEGRPLVVTLEEGDEGKGEEEEEEDEEEISEEESEEPIDMDIKAEVKAEEVKAEAPAAPTVPRPSAEARRDEASGLDVDPPAQPSAPLAGPLLPLIKPDPDDEPQDELGPGPLGPLTGPLLSPDQPPMPIKAEPGTAPGEARFTHVWLLPYDAAELAALRRRYLEPRVVTVEISSATRSGAVRMSSKQRKCRPAAEQSYERLWPHLQRLSEDGDEEAAAAAGGGGAAGAPSALAAALLAALRILRAYEAACGLDAAPRDAALSRVLPAYGAEVTAARNAAAEVTSAEVLDMTAEEIDVEAYVLQQWPAEVVARVAVKREAV